MPGTAKPLFRNLMDIRCQREKARRGITPALIRRTGSCNELIAPSGHQGYQGAKENL